MEVPGEYNGAPATCILHDDVFVEGVMRPVMTPDDAACRAPAAPHLTLPHLLLNLVIYDG